MEVKYVNLKVDRSGYSPSSNRLRRSQPPRRNPYRKYNKRWTRKRHHYGLILFVAILVVLAGVTLFNALTPKTDPVENLKSTKATQDSVTLKWKTVKDADGYIIYTKALNDSDFKKADSVKKVNNYTVKKLKALTDYTFAVTAYRKGDNIIESEKRTVDAYTITETPVFTECKSVKEKEINLAWKAVKSAVKYQVQYAKNSAKFSDAEIKAYNSSKNPKYTLGGLEKSGYYTLRIRATAAHGETFINSDWSDASTVYIAENFTLRRDIDPSKPMVALTFDDGPGYNKASSRILDTLEKYGAKATFFMVGRNAANQPKNVQRKLNLGMELGNHTWNHAHYSSNVTYSDINKASNAVFDACGQYPTAFRSPGGMTTDSIKADCKKLNMPIYYWSIDTQDWLSRDADKVYDMVMNNVGDGDIILMHEIYNSTADAVKRMVPKLIKKGYQLVTCRELMYAKNGKAPVAGKEYITPDQEKTS